jgi:hypothetical protein
MSVQVAHHNVKNEQGPIFDLGANSAMCHSNLLLFATPLFGLMMRVWVYVASSHGVGMRSWKLPIIALL